MKKKDSVFIPIIISLSIIIPLAVAALMMFSNYLHISSANDFSYLPLFSWISELILDSETSSVDTSILHTI